MFAQAAWRRVALAATALAVSFAIEPIHAPAFAASEVVAVVDRTPITSTDVAKRVAFLKLQRRTGNLQKMARDELVDEALKREEVARVRMSVSTEDVDKSFERFAAGNKLSAAQMATILNQAGVGVEHFKAYIAVQMSWPRVVNARFGSGRMSSEELVKRMMEKKEKPVTTEYFLQQVIFVVPQAKRNAILAKRKAEAEKSRASFPGCDQSKQFAKTMLDVSIRNLGRVMQPELPDDWRPLIEKAAANGTTGTRVTERGVEFLAICNQRQVSDDTAAEVVFRAEDLGKEKKTGENPNDAKYLEELRGKAQIVYP
ncbi:peptidylprolyl isomerase [Rhizobium sp. SSA_523]|uniref:SurA N-terminal domain-containing protein n=1 Tax=Rhizobium sp. SSA_523 TaxID=2952477 RepID=UPI002090CD33|nr:peptidylprolyl isomerase [Rhizobium sp. SSA_523]MCO5730762.1 peptidylprolyl isomerase [Rhizobium sp. SSA_523]WKC24414.1 peptidylprolyl isomerase [Rhizobium sp. SSA_523]